MSDGNPRLNRDQFVRGVERDMAKGLNLIRSKNADYGANSDPFRNFRMSEAVFVSVEKAILVRMQDKMSRLGTYCESGKLSVQNESVQDTILDLANYAYILAQYLKEKDGMLLVDEEARSSFPNKVQPLGES